MNMISHDTYYDSPEKQEVRQIIENSVRSGNRKFMGFAGKDFVLEQMLFKSHPELILVSLEKNKFVYLKQQKHKFVTDGIAPIEIHHKSVVDFLGDITFGRKDCPPEHRANIIWLDFTGPVSVEVLDSIKLCLTTNAVIHNGLFVVTISCNRCHGIIYDQYPYHVPSVELYKRRFIQSTEEEIAHAGYLIGSMFERVYRSKHNIMLTVGWRLDTNQRKSKAYNRSDMPGYDLIKERIKLKERS